MIPGARSFIRLGPLALLLLLLLSLSAACSDPLLIGDLPDCTGLWVKKIGDGSTDNGPSAMSFAVDSTNDILLSGMFTGTLDLGGAPLDSVSADGDLFLAKVTDAGALLWSKRFVGASLSSIATDKGDVILTGSLDGTVDFGSASLHASQLGTPFIAKLDPQGNYLWGNVFEWTDVAGALGGRHTVKAAVDGAGFLVLSGELDGSLDLGGASVSATHGAYLARLDPSGKLLWSKAFDNAFLDAVTNPAGEIGVAGNFLGTLDLGGASEPLDSFTSDDPQPFIARLSAKGTTRYAMTIGSTSTSYSNYQGTAFALDADGSVVLTGQNSTPHYLLAGTLVVAPFQSYVFKLDPAGKLAWGKLGSGVMSSDGVVTDSDGKVFVFGTLNNGLFPDSSVTFGDCASGDHQSAFVMGLSPTGGLLSCRLLDHRQEGNPDNLFHVNHLAPAGDGKLVLGGEFTGRLSLTCATLTTTATGPRGNEILARIAP